MLVVQVSLLGGLHYRGDSVDGLLQLSFACIKIPSLITPGLVLIYAVSLTGVHLPILLPRSYLTVFYMRIAARIALAIV